MRLAVAQLRTGPGDLARAPALIEERARAAADCGADLLVFPVTTLVGPEPLPLRSQGLFLLDALGELRTLADTVACPCLVPLVVDLEDRLVCETVLLEGGRATPLRCRRMASPLPEEGEWQPDVPVSFELGSTRLGIATLPEEVDALVRDEQRVDVVIYLLRYGFAVDDPSSALGAYAPGGRPVVAERAFGTWFVGVGAVGGYGSHVFTGSSFAVAPDGSLADLAPAFDEALLVVEVGEPSMATPLRAEPYELRHHLWRAIELGIRDHVSASGASDAMLVLDGGMASSVLAVLASDALGPTHVHALLAADGERSAEVANLARKLHVDTRSLSSGGDASSAMLELASSARRSGALPLVSVDKTGLALEEACALVPSDAFAPLADVWRSDVLDIARLRNAVSPVFATLSLTACDIPAPLRSITDLHPEQLLRRIDDILAGHLVGVPFGTGSWKQAGELAARVVGLWNARDLGRQVRMPHLVLSTTPLYDFALPSGFVWHDPGTMSAKAASAALDARLRELVGLADEGAGALLSEDGPFGESVLSQMLPSTLGETLDLLRDLSAGGELPDWYNPFSEN